MLAHARKLFASLGHNGLKSITQMLGTPDYHRLRIGIGRPELKEMVSDYVLQPFTKAEAKAVQDAMPDMVAKALGTP